MYAQSCQSLCECRHCVSKSVDKMMCLKDVEVWWLHPEVETLVQQCGLLQESVMTLPPIECTLRGKFAVICTLATF